MSVTEDYLLDEQDKRFEEAAEKASFVSCHPFWFHFFMMVPLSLILLSYLQFYYFTSKFPFKPNCKSWQMIMSQLRSWGWNRGWPVCKMPTMSTAAPLAGGHIPILIPYFDSKWSHLINFDFWILKLAQHWTNIELESFEENILLTILDFQNVGYCKNYKKMFHFIRHTSLLF